MLLQTQYSSSQIPLENRFKGITDCFKRIYHEQGFTSLWRGASVNMVRTGIFSATFYSIYSSDAENKTISGAVAGTTALLLTYPLETAYVRLTTDIGNGSNRMYKGFSDCMRKVYSKDGARGWYRGVVLSQSLLLISGSALFGNLDDFEGVLNSPLLCLLCYGMDTVRRTKMLQFSEFSGTFNSNMYKNEGFKSFYRGGLTSIIHKWVFYRFMCCYSRNDIILIKIFSDFDHVPPTNHLFAFEFSSESATNLYHVVKC
jgi:solute carrier family 25 (adenine nucleotide translocator) protein 4/5/6/31